MNELDCVKATIKTGNEKLTFNNKALGFTLLDFWCWSVSDIMSNATRGVFAEFIVATAAKIDLNEVRSEWGAFDLKTKEGIKIEVKSSAYLQTWFQKALSKISFGTKAAFVIDIITNKQSELKIRSADVYVFCLLHHKDKRTVQPLNLDHWEFYVLATEQLNNYVRSQHSISLNSLKRLTVAVDYENLGNEIKMKNIFNNKNRS
jgi:hypothetical protein